MLVKRGKGGGGEERESCPFWSALAAEEKCGRGGGEKERKVSSSFSASAARKGRKKKPLRQTTISVRHEGKGRRKKSARGERDLM